MRTILILLGLVVVAGCGGGSSDGGRRRSGPDPSGPDLAYPAEFVSFRVGEDAAPFGPTSAGFSGFAIDPALPAGLDFDADTGTISGTPAVDSHRAVYTVTADHADGEATSELTLSVTPTLPPELLELAPGYAAEAFATLDVPVKMAFAPDGRLFVNELTSGRVRIVAADGTVATDPFAELTVVTGGERGLIGLALAPDFDTSGHVFVLATVSPAGGGPDVNRITRYTAVGDRGTDETIVVDGLPAAFVHNAGDLAFGPDGMLYVSIGDAGDRDLPQTDGSRAGRVLRYRPDGTVPDDNPIPGDPEWCRGLRNSFDLCFHPRTGGLFASENGPTFGDEVNFIQRGSNYEWEELPAGFPGSRIGLRITDWTPVIAPTGVTFSTAPDFGLVDNLFVLGYVEADVRRLVMSGPGLTDLDEEVPFAAFDNTGGVANKPLDAKEGPDGALYISTFSGIWRITRW